MTLIKYFTLNARISNEDSLSALPDDCFREICTNLDHDDLDVLATVNQRLCYASKNSRDSAQKTVAFSLRVQVNEQRDLCLRFDRSAPHLSVYMQQNSSGLTRRINYVGYLPFNIEHNAWSEVKSTSSYVLKQAAFLMGRYYIKEVQFESMVIDHDFVNIFERAIHNKSFKVRALLFRKCSLEKPRYSDVAKRMLNLLANIKALSSYISEVYGLLKDINESFIRKLADGINFPILNARGPISVHNLFHVKEDFADILAKYDHLKCNSLVVEAEWIMKAILNRLRRQVEGSHFCTLNRIIDVIEIEQSLEPDLQYFMIKGRDIIWIRDTPHFAIIKLHYDTIVPNMYYLEVLFRTHFQESEFDGIVA